MMYRFNAANNWICIAILLLNVYIMHRAHCVDSASFLSNSFAGNNVRPFRSSNSINQAKTHCHCTLVAGKLKDRFDTDDIAVSFTVTIKKSGNSTSPDEKRRFVLVRDIRANFLLALPDDSGLLSLTTLQHCVQTSSVDMYPSPGNNSNCFETLDALCKDAVIVAAFYNTSEFHVKQGQPICFPPLEEKNVTEKSNIVHQCCSWQRNLNSGYVNCSQVINPNTWVAYAVLAVQVGSAVLFLLAPLLFKYLPTRDTQIVRRSRATGPKRLGYSNYLATPVDSVTTNRKLLTLGEPLSFVTCGGDEAQACYSRICRVTGLFIFPLLFCIFIVVFFITNNDTKIRTNVSYYTGLVGFLQQPVEYYVFAIVVFCILLLGILLLIPGRLSGVGKALSGRKDEKTFLGFPKPEQYMNHSSGNSGFQFMQSNMVFHLKCCFDIGFWLFILKIIFAPCTFLCCCARDSASEQLTDSDESSYRTPMLFRVLGVILLPIIMGMWMPFVLFCLVVYVTPVGYVAFRIFRFLYSQDMPFNCECCEQLPACIRIVVVSFLYLMFILFCTCVLGSYIFMTLMFGVFFYILGKIFLYTLIGLGFNVEFYVPYAVAAFFVVFYIWRAFSHYFSVYENLRIVLFEECEKYEQQEPLQHASSSNGDSSSISSQTAGPGLLLLDNNNNPSIPLNLYVAVYRRLRPRSKTFLTILMKLLLTLFYVSLAFAAIMSLNKAEDTSSYAQAIFLCATFALPLVLSYGSSSHAKRRRKELEYKVRFIIHRYVSKLEIRPESSVTDNPRGSGEASVEFSPPNTTGNMFEI